MTQPIAVYTKCWQSSGAGLFAQELVQGIINAGSEVIFIAPPSEDPRFDFPRKGLCRFVSPVERTSGPRLARVASSLARVAGGAVGLARARLSTRIFLVTIPDPPEFSLPILFALWLTGARIIYIVHDPLPHAWRFAPWLRWLENACFSMAYRLSRGLVVLSDAGRPALAAAYALGQRPIAVIEHGVFLLDRPTPAPGSGTLLLFGTLRRNKGVREAIEGVVEARRRGCAVTLLIAGAPDPVEEHFWDECLIMARAHSDAVILEIGYVADERLEKLMAACDALLLPYRAFNSQSGVAILAASNGRPIIASRAGGIGDLIADGMAAEPITDPVDAPAVASAIAAFYATPIAAWNLRAADYRTRTLETRAWPVIGQQYIEFARKIDGG